MLNWLTEGFFDIGWYANNILTLVAFTVWIILFLREMEFRKNYKILRNLVIISLAGALFLPIIGLMIIQIFKGSFISYISNLPQIFSHIKDFKSLQVFIGLIYRGMTLTGGVFILTVLLLFVRGARVFLFPYLYSLPIFVAIARVGCFSMGCCFGRTTDLPLAVIYPPASHASIYHKSQHLIMSMYAKSMPVHPVQLYIVASMIMVFIALYIMRRRGIDLEIIAATSLICYGLINFNMEFIRQEPVVLWIFTVGQILEAAITLLGVYIILSRKKAEGDAPH